MDKQLISLVVTIAFFVVILFLGVMSALGIYIFTRYGRTRSYTLWISLLYVVLFGLMTLSAYATLQKLIDYYA